MSVQLTKWEHGTWNCTSNRGDSDWIIWDLYDGMFEEMKNGIKSKYRQFTCSDYDETYNTKKIYKKKNNK